MGLADLQITEVGQRVFLLTYGAYKAWQDFIVSALQVNSILFSIPLLALVELWESEAMKRMKKPTLRVTKCLGDIPIEANCTACSDLSFKAKTATNCNSSADRKECQSSLQSQFDAHFKATHWQEPMMR